MAYTKKTLLDLKQSLADRHNSGKLPTASDTLTFWTRLFNRGQAYCADKLKLLTSTSLTTASGTIALPDNFIEINDVVDSSGEKFTQISREDSALAESGQYWITGDHDTGFYLNAESDETFTVYYSFRPSEMSDNTDECIIPDPEAVVAYAYAFLRKSETDPIGDADSALQECDNRLMILLSNKNINDKPVEFSLSI